MKISPNIYPALVTLGLMTVMVAVIVLINNGDPLALARLGTRYSLGDPSGTEGYDGQFAYYIAMNPDPKSVAIHLDVPAYRYQRILYPLLARILTLGKTNVIPWVFPLIGILAQFFGTWVLASMLISWMVNPWYALIYSLWVGFSLAIRLDLPETLAFALVILAIFAIIHERIFLGCLALVAAVFSKEVTLPFVGAILLGFMLKRNWKAALIVCLVVLLPYSLFQFWLFSFFGAFGIGSGGAMATSFEVIPLMGLFRIWQFSPLYTLMMLLVFLPCTIAPAIWGLIFALRRIVSNQDTMILLVAILNSAMIFFLPFSTFRETGGLLRISCGLILAILLLAAKFRVKRVLNYGFLLIAYNAFLLK
jgi:hypothetical protein